MASEAPRTGVQARLLLPPHVRALALLRGLRGPDLALLLKLLTANSAEDIAATAAGSTSLRTNLSRNAALERRAKHKVGSAACTSLGPESTAVQQLRPPPPEKRQHPTRSMPPAAYHGKPASSWPAQPEPTHDRLVHSDLPTQAAANPAPEPKAGCREQRQPRCCAPQIQLRPDAPKGRSPPMKPQAPG
eukprot:CAMPEP_0204368782 /NCGR_PEP_ID=MMETSP0469-20131031/44461_1 /ASSEMBLY_ACC=CAM_ASM_000384 /TAXON_ID=2969 /ORGANISM="Oxyrrhis marina" /LENGTH=188 /DNA_ID=CAMNT_0051358403 /DNA_START=73 /DNA_END=637 /DNA_ORIENTATION=+